MEHTWCIFLKYVVENPWKISYFKKLTSVYTYFGLWDYSIGLYWYDDHCYGKTLQVAMDISMSQRSATFNVKIAILALSPPNKIHMEPQNIWYPNKDNTVYG